MLANSLGLETPFLLHMTDSLHQQGFSTWQQVGHRTHTHMWAVRTRGSCYKEASCSFTPPLPRTQLALVEDNVIYIMLVLQHLHWKVESVL